MVQLGERLSLELDDDVEHSIYVVGLLDAFDGMDLLEEASFCGILRLYENEGALHVLAARGTPIKGFPRGV